MIATYGTPAPKDARFAAWLRERAAQFRLNHGRSSFAAMLDGLAAEVDPGPDPGPVPGPSPPPPLPVPEGTPDVPTQDAAWNTPGTAPSPGYLPEGDGPE